MNLNPIKSNMTGLDLCDGTKELKMNCALRSDKKTKLFSIPWTSSGNHAVKWYCSRKRVKKGLFWNFCKEHRLEVGDTLEAWHKKGRNKS